ncbi:Arylsulfatase A [Halorientalis persicus]|uniref:Arylsulfatase A n=1 Tax=Halorientalis persicus TaxID=1367881 RepID=A0A1H8W6J8_9EURY|nr:sulfatase-like hydrolase/transferase [Halorientalis persicus]SEP23229.1 Arylsulfatase A [Halorientalis persicus]
MKRNVALIVLDTVRWDRFRENAPRLIEKADTVFTECRTASIWSVPSHASMFTGKLPSEHERTTFDRNMSLQDTVVNDLDGTTACVSANIYASSTYDFSDSFDEFLDISNNRRLPEGEDISKIIRERDVDEGLGKYLSFFRTASEHGAPVKTVLNGMFVKGQNVFRELPVESPFDSGAEVVSRGIKQTVDSIDEPFFLFTNYMDAHAPLYPIRHYRDHSVPNTWDASNYGDGDIQFQENISEEDRQHIKNHQELYECSLDYLDRRVSEMVDWLESNTQKETTVIVTADHGENLRYDGDRNMVSHSSAMTEGLTHVPMLVFNPPSGYPDTYDELWSHLDLRDLVLNISQNSPDIPSRDVIPVEVLGAGEGDFDGPEEYLDLYRRAIRCVYRDGKKWVWDSNGNTWEEVGGDLLDTDSVPNTDIWSESLQDTRKRLKEASSDNEISSEAKDRLEELGYA